MPHIVVKLYPGCTEEQKENLASLITRDVMSALNKPEGSVSIAMEEVSPDDWAEKVFRPEILEYRGKLYQKPGYNPFADKT